MSINTGILHHVSSPPFGVCMADGLLLQLFFSISKERLNGDYCEFKKVCLGRWGIVLIISGLGLLALPGG